LYPWGIVLSPAVGAVLMGLSTVVVAFNAQLLRASAWDTIKRLTVRLHRAHRMQYPS